MPEVTFPLPAVARGGRCHVPFVTGLLAASMALGLCGCTYHVVPLVRTGAELFPPAKTTKEPVRLLVHYKAPIEAHHTTHTSMFPLTRMHRHFYTGRAFDSVLVSCLSANAQKVRRTRKPSGSADAYDYLVTIDRFTSELRGVFTFKSFIYFTCEVRDAGGKRLAKTDIEVHTSAVTYESEDTLLWAMERGLGDAMEKASVDCVKFVLATVKAGGEEQ